MPNAYGPRIRAARAFAGLSQDQLADALGVDAQTIKRRESGAQEPKKGERLAIAQICGVPTSFLEEGFGIATRDEILEAVAHLARQVADLTAESRERAAEEAESLAEQEAQRRGERDGQTDASAQDQGDPGEQQ